MAGGTPELGAQEVLTPSGSLVGLRPQRPSRPPIEVGWQSPTLWAVAFLTIGVTCGGAIAGVVSAWDASATAVRVVARDSTQKRRPRR